MNDENEDYEDEHCEVDLLEIFYVIGWIWMILVVEIVVVGLEYEEDKKRYVDNKRDY